ncbi:hypothetical protein [Streptomyces sp. NRRL WC-3742]|uniref:hypothetical protein n=1 Tax=Streptomyces sp. NRRL WC-3742 TaxID=1463934 RepID=UPI0004C8C291|nr:hypothetical protein [Streptomyces sp. NRRL WC-3742]
MSYPPDPNNPYGQTQPQGYGYPQQQPAGYGYPQQQPQPAAYGYPPVGQGYGFPPAAPQSMPGLVLTTRVLLFVIGGVQVILTAILLIIAGGAKHEANTRSGDIATIGNAAAGVLLVLGIVYLLASILSITLGAKFGKGGPATRITTLVYGCISLLLGLLVLFSGLTQSSANNPGGPFGLIIGVLWIGISILWIVAMSTRDGVAWFNRPRY